MRRIHIISYTAQKMKFSIKDFFGKCDQIRRNLQIWSHLLKKSLLENFIFLCAVLKAFLSGIKRPIFNKAAVELLGRSHKMTRFFPLLKVPHHFSSTSLNIKGNQVLSEIQCNQHGQQFLRCSHTIIGQRTEP